MYHVTDLEAGEVNLVDSLDLVAQLVAVQGMDRRLDVSKYPVALALAYVERFAVARVDQPVDVGLELRRYVGREGVGRRHIVLTFKTQTIVRSNLATSRPPKLTACH